MIIQQIRNATLKITYGGYTFLTDPWLQDKGTGFSAPVVKKEMEGIKSPLNDLPLSIDDILKDVEFCLVTHIHPDHFKPDYLPKEMKIYVQNKEDVLKVNDKGLYNVHVIGDEGLNLSSLSISKTPAKHGDNDVLVLKMGEVSGYYIEGEKKSLYIAGDTVFYKAVEDVLREKDPDVVVINCCEATMPTGRLIMHIPDIDEVYKLSSHIIIASHLDNVNHALLTRDDIKKHKNSHQMDRLLIPDDGEILVFD